MLVVLLLLFFHLMHSAAAEAAHCHPSDKATLTSFKNSFSSSNTNPFSSWDPAVFPDCCDWNGVSCNYTSGYVIGLDIAIYLSLNGTIPSSLSHLKHLINLRLHKMPLLSGPIPPSLSTLSTLRTLVISWTGVSGPIPPSLSRLANLEYLDLSFNSLSGSIPPSLPTLELLITIDLSRNRLSGPIPDTTYGHLPKTINFSYNNLSGPLPSSLSNVNFTSIDLSRNSLSGDASVLLGKVKRTGSIDISRNEFEFDFSKVSFMEDLYVLDVSHNKIYGRIPEGITDAVSLEALNVSYNRLCGEIPKVWKLKKRVESWELSSFFHNRCLCGAPLPPCNVTH